MRSSNVIPITEHNIPGWYGNFYSIFIFNYFSVCITGMKLGIATGCVSLHTVHMIYLLLQSSTKYVIMHVSINILQAMAAKYIF